MFHPIKSDRRYEIQLEWCGHETPHYVLRWCGDFIASSISRAAMVTRAVGHKAQRDGALTIEGKDS